MLREQSGILLVTHQLIDLVIVTCSFYLAYLTKTNLPFGWENLSGNYNYLFFLLLALITYHVSLRLYCCYDRFRLLDLKLIICRVLKAAIAGGVGIIFINYLLHLDAVSRLFVGIFCLYSYIGLACFKIAVYRVLARTRSNNVNTRAILLIGSKQRALDFCEIVCRKSSTGYRVIGCLEITEEKHLIGRKIYKDISVIGILEDFKSTIENHIVDEIVFAIPLKKIPDVYEYIYFAEEAGINIRVLPDFQLNSIKYFPQTARLEIEDFLGATTLFLTSTPKNINALIIKTALDYTLACIGILMLLPLTLLISIAIKCTSKGPIYYTQTRIGLNGRKFKIIKFRTMVLNADDLRHQLLDKNEQDGPAFKINCDPRITAMGHLLRKTSLDELPQLFNVLRGEMSLVGPRPPLPSEVLKYKLRQRRRLSMKPGLTCIWQVSGRNSISFEEWMNMDLEYIDTWSLALDMKLLGLTLKEIAYGGGR